MIKLCFYVPESHLEKVKQAIFATGAGRIGGYDSCAWQTRGQGQFRPLPGSAPFIGEHERFTQVVEYQVEMVCQDDQIKAAIAALKEAHPYEEPAYSAWPLLDL